MTHIFQQADIPEGNVEYKDVDAFQKIMPQNYRLIVVEIAGGKLSFIQRRMW